MHNGAYDVQMERWGQLSRGVAEHASDAAFLQSDQERLIQARRDAWEAKQRQLRHRAAAQQATRDLEAAMARAQEAATRLQCGLLGKLGAANPKLIAFGMYPRRVGKARARSAAVLETFKAAAAAASGGGTPPHHAAEPANREGALPTAGGTSPRVEADAAWAGGTVPQAEGEVAALSRTAREHGGEAPQAEKDVGAEGETAPPAVESVQIEMADAIPRGSSSRFCSS
jgi:hypothetical protein